MLPTERLDYSPIAGRRRLELPDGARMAVWVIVNVEEWDPVEPMPRTVLTPPAGGAPMPDIPNWAWHEYGNRVGFWRLLEVLDRHFIRAVLAVNGSAIAALRADRRGGSRPRLGIHRPRFHPEEHAENRRRAPRHPQNRGGDPRRRRPNPARLARAGADRDLGDARPAGRGGLRLRLRLGARRRAGLAQDPHPADRQPALHAGMQRRGDDADPASCGGRILSARDRSVRAALSRCAPIGADHGAGRAPLHHGRAASHEIFRRRPRRYPCAPTTCCSGPANKSSTGSCGFRELRNEQAGPACRDQDRRSDDCGAGAAGDADIGRSRRRGDQDRSARRRHHALCGPVAAPGDGPCFSEPEPQQALAVSRSEAARSGRGAASAAAPERRVDAQHAPAGDGAARLRL